MRTLKMRFIGFRRHAGNSNSMMPTNVNELGPITKPAKGFPNRQRAWNKGSCRLVLIEQIVYSAGSPGAARPDDGAFVLIWPI
jgi:hypothetical protein